MTNQTAQTMPTLPRPYWKAGDVKDDYGNPYNETDLFTDDDMRAMYQQGYAAALAQTAGVADGWKLVPVEPTEVMCEAAMSSRGWTRSEAAAKTAPITPASPMMEGSMKVWSAMLATAPAASGGEVWTREMIADVHKRGEELFQRINPQAAAPVSERARELGEPVMTEQEAFKLFKPIRRVMGKLHAEIGWYADEYTKPAEESIDAIEQALTQQRATPQPSADAVRELVSKMYGGAVAVGSDGQWVSVRRYLLDELESLISGGSHA